MRRDMGMRKEITKDYVKDIGERMIFFAQQSDGSVYITQFLVDEGLSYETFREWLDRYPELARDYREAKEIMACKVLTNALHRKYDSSISKWFVNCISKEFRQATKEIAQEEEQREHTVIIKEIRADDNVDD